MLELLETREVRLRELEPAHAALALRRVEGLRIAFSEAKKESQGGACLAFGREAPHKEPHRVDRRAQAAHLNPVDEAYRRELVLLRMMMNLVSETQMPFSCPS